MRLVHLADLHLGYRAFQRVAKNGMNIREADIARAFRVAMDEVIALKPDLIVVAGDVFHASRPPNNAIVHAHRQFARLRSELPDAVVVIVAGNHDTPRAADTGSILALFEPLGIHVATNTAKRIAVPDRGLSVLAVPDVSGPRPLLEPDPNARYNVLVLHGEVEYAASEAPHAWDYVALGHYHVHRQVAPRACYAGAIEYTSTDAFGELAEERKVGVAGKGFVVHDLATGAQTFHAASVSRVFVELPDIRATEKSTPAEIDTAIAAAVDGCSGGIDDKVVRLIVRDITRPVARGLDLKAIRSYRARALNFQLVFEKPAEIIAARSERPARRRLSLTEIVRESFAKRDLPSDVDRAALTNLALAMLGEATEQDSTTLSAEPEPVAVESGVSA